MSHIAETIIEAIDPFHHPATRRLDSRHAEARKPLEHAIVHHRGQRHTRILNDIHTDKHESRVRLLVPLIAEIKGMDDKMNSHGQVEILCGCPYRIEIGVAKAFPIDWHCAHEYRLHPFP